MDIETLLRRHYGPAEEDNARLTAAMVDRIVATATRRPRRQSPSPWSWRAAAAAGLLLAMTAGLASGLLAALVADRGAGQARDLHRPHPAHEAFLHLEQALLPPMGEL